MFFPGKPYRDVVDIVIHSLVRHSPKGPHIQRRLRSCYRSALQEAGLSVPMTTGRRSRR